ncbi:MAG: SDR family oxidoreductase [Planctomycetes bacterium]|nr:SDR family oxidoreductase [Planctomycetota bacterium]
MEPRNAIVTLITGAGSGIGRACALQLARRKHHLVLAGRTESKLADAADEILAFGSGEVMIARADISDPAQARSVVDQTLERFGRVDNLVNAAGVAALAPIEKTTKELLSDTFATNTFGPAYLIAACWPRFRTQKSGCVVNVSSLASQDPFPGFFVYAASKAALDSMTRSVAREGAALGVRTFCVNPGGVETPMLRSLFNEKAIPKNQTLAPEAVATVIVDCIEGRRESDQGKIIVLSNP